jgi:tetratricopeptide (TPR) repeat protein
MPDSIRVFFSYSWDSEVHKQRVLKLAQRLRKDGVDAWLDFFTMFPAEGWQRWMENEIEKARFVVVIATEKYEQRFAGKSPKGVGLGATWEGAIITTDLYETGGRNEKFVPAFFSKEDEPHIPKPLRPYTRFDVSEDTGYIDLYRLVTGQPKVVAAPLGKKRKLSGGTKGATLPALDIPPIHEHAAAHSNLPRLPYGFFGREDELKKIAHALAPDIRTWGVLIDGPGGIGKTALAIRSAEQTPPGQFERIIFLSAKSQELTPEGSKKLTNFIVPAYLDMLNELARQIDKSELTKVEEKERARMLQQALQTQRALLIFDNLESLSTEDRNSVFDFLGRLPLACKAIVTSRRRSDTEARIIRLERLSQEAAIEFIAKLAEDRPLLQKTNQAERIALYTATGGNPLLIRWVVGQLGRGGCRTLDDSLKLLASAPAANDPLEFIFGDLVDTFTESETKAIAALSHFTLPIEVKFIAELGGLPNVAAQTALEDLADRALVIGDSESRVFTMQPQVGQFLRRKRPGAVFEAGERLADRAYAVAVENGYQKHDRFHLLESQWTLLSGALPLFLQGPNERLQTVCAALRIFFESSGRWDEWLSFELQSAKKAVAGGDFFNAGWRMFQAGWVYFLREDSKEVLACAENVESYWKQTSVTTTERVQGTRLYGIGYQIAGNYPAALDSYREALELSRADSLESVAVANLLGDLADVERLVGDLQGAERDYQEALRVARNLDDLVAVGAYITNLAVLALDREDWMTAEALAREALPLHEKLIQKEFIAASCSTLADALNHQRRNSEARPYAKRAVEMFTVLGSSRLDYAQRVLAATASTD